MSMFVVLRDVAYEEKNRFLGLWTDQEAATRWAEAEWTQDPSSDTWIHLYEIKQLGPWQEDGRDGAVLLRTWAEKAPAHVDSYQAHDGWSGQHDLPAEVVGPTYTKTETGRIEAISPDPKQLNHHRRLE